MFIRANTDAAKVDLGSVSYEELCELSFDALQQNRLDGDEDADTDAWDALLRQKCSETRH